MLTLFAAPKPMLDEHTRILQRNALGSWLAIGSEVEVILFGDEAGIDDLAREFNVRHVPEIKRNEYGTPLISDIFARGEELASNDLLGYLNSDIILFPEVITAVQDAYKRFGKFLMIGHRFNVDVDSIIDFFEKNPDDVRECLMRNAEIGPIAAIDYFLFSKGAIGDLPPFAVGRFCWDNWTIWNTRKRGISVIDATAEIAAIHQNHDYGHVQGQREGEQYLAESNRNYEIAGGLRKFHVWSCKILDATYLYKNGRFYRAWTWRHFRRKLKRAHDFFSGTMMDLIGDDNWSIVKKILMVEACKKQKKSR